MNPEQVFVGSDNIFADLDLPNPTERLAKAEISIIIEQIIDHSGLTQVEAAERMGLAQPDVSNIIRGRLKGYTVDRLLLAVMALGQNVHITITPKPTVDEFPHMDVTYEMERELTAA